jgi:hypothetical protein
MAKAYANAFDMFNANEVKTAKIEALNGAEVKYRELTMTEADSFSQRLIKDYGTDGSKPVIDFDEATKIKYEKASLVLIEPKMSVEDLRALPSSAMGAINEINALIDGSDDDSVDEEGNSES